MKAERTIQYLRHGQIDKTKWDACIEASSNGLVYGYSFYLDQMAGDWEALVMDNYQMVMPLTAKKKYGIQYLAQPFLTAQLGLFGNGIDAGLMEQFFLAIPSRFKYCDIYLNHGNVFSVPGYELYNRTNFILDLEKNYEDIEKGYRENIRRNIRRCREAGCVAANTTGVDAVIDLAMNQMQKQSSESLRHVSDFTKLFHLLEQKKMAEVHGIVSPAGKLLASAVFFFSHGRTYYILVGNHPDGRTLGASHALIDSFIKQNSGKKLLLDFEGSDIRNLAFFYSSFGAKEEMYAALKWNRLPALMKWIKK
jgi:hypothetical protein